MDITGGRWQVTMEKPGNGGFRKEVWAPRVTREGMSGSEQGRSRVVMECSLISLSSDLSREFADSLTDAPGRLFAPRELGLGLIFHSW